MGNIKFGTGGFRAIIGEDFNKQNVQKICQAICNVMIKENKKKEICIGYDNRFMSEDFAMWCAEVFAGNEIIVKFFDRATSTPVCMYATKVCNNDYGVMITASHNPYKYNGVKVFVSEGKDASVEDCNKIENEINSLKTIKSANFENEINRNIFYVNFLEQYVDNIINLFDIKNLNNIKVVYDPKYGSTAEELVLFSDKVDLKNYEIINSKRDAFFGFNDPAPNENNIELLKQQVVSTGADVGFALDADGDRLAVLDENGNYIDNNYILAVSYYFLVKYFGKTGGAVKNVATSNLLDEVSKKFGYDCKEVPVGFKYISKGIIETNAVVGGESSGGLAIQGHIWGKDSLLSIAICLKAMVVMKKSFGEIIEEVLAFAGNYNKVISDKQYSFSKAQEEHIKRIIECKQLPNQKHEIENIVWSDYVKIYYKNKNWLLIRFSGTEPVVRIFAEADSKKESEELILDWQNFLGL